MRNAVDHALPTFLKRRRKALGLRQIDVVRRMGYTNVAKGVRRLDALERGTGGLFPSLTQALANALSVQPKLLEDLVRESRNQESRDDMAAYRAHFRPHLVWDTTHDVPTQIFVAALCGGFEKMHGHFRQGSDPGTFIEQAKAMVPDSGGVPGFGKIVGFVVNYSPDEAIRYDLDGNMLERLPTARRIGRPTMQPPIRFE